MNLVGWLKSLFRRREKVLIVRVPETAVTLDQWRGDYDLVRLAREIWQNNGFQIMVSCVRNSNPGMFVLPDNAPPHQRMARHAQAEGYQMCLNNLEALAKFQKPEEPLESTFEPEERPIMQPESRL